MRPVRSSKPLIELGNVMTVLQKQCLDTEASLVRGIVKRKGWALPLDGNIVPSNTPSNAFTKQTHENPVYFIPF